MLTFQTMDVNTIIKRALILIRAESIFQDENQDARAYVLDALNDILYVMNAAGGDYIPYYKIFNFNLSTGISTYLLGTSADATVRLPKPISAIDYVDLMISGYQYPVVIQDNFGALYNARTVTISGRPTWVWVLRGEDEFRLQFFPVPNSDYECRLLYKDSISPVAYQDAIALPAEYRALLIYWLAKRINSEGGYSTWSENNQQELDKINTTIKASVQTDYRIRSFPPYSNTFGYSSFNLGVISR